MKIKYNQQLDILHIRFNDEKVEKSDSQKPGVMLNFDGKGSIVAIEILNASRKMPQLTKFDTKLYK